MDQPQFQQEFLSKIAQIDFLVNTCQQLTNTMSIMQREIDALKIEQENLSARNDFLLVSILLLE